MTPKGQFSMARDTTSTSWAVDDPKNALGFHI